jgi:hypothetical protein
MATGVSGLGMGSRIASWAAGTLGLLVLAPACARTPVTQTAPAPVVMMQTRTPDHLAPPTKDADSAGEDASASVASASVASAAADPTLQTSQYVLYGIPSPTRVWSSGDYLLAAQAIQKLYDENPDLLPRLESLKSGFVFQRMVASENLAILSDASVPTPTRDQAGGAMFDGLSTITALYVRAGDQDRPLQREIQALQEQLQRLSVSMAALRAEQVPAAGAKH